jgi:hypothetical protein
VRNLKIDPVTGGFVLAGGVLQFVEDGDAVAQAVRCELKTFLGEYFLDPTRGVPYIQMGRDKRTSPLVFGSVVRRIILAVPGMRSVDTMAFNYDPETRELDVAWSGTTVYSTPVSDVTTFGG